MKIIFIRHADSNKNELTKKGMKQAKILAEKLMEEKIDEIYCSNLRRAKQTAEIIRRRIKIKPKIENSLNEFESEMIKKPKGRWNKKEKERYKKLVKFLKSLTKNPDENKTILIVSHGVTNRIILAYFLGINLKKAIRFWQNEAAINSIYWSKKFKNWRLERWNC